MHLLSFVRHDRRSALLFGMAGSALVVVVTSFAICETSQRADAARSLRTLKAASRVDDGTLNHKLSIGRYFLGLSASCTSAQHGSPNTTVVAPQSNRVRLVVASSVMLTFISFWRAAAIVLNDLGSSAFYAGGIAEEAVGKSAPWLILGVVLFSFAVRAVYVESCSMFTRGGVYRIVKEALGGTFAKLSVSALMFDYVLTGPISGVSAGQYIVGLLNDLIARASLTGITRPSTSHHTSAPIIASAVIAIVITIYFWWQNIKGIEESSEKALDVMKITTVMVVLLLAWGSSPSCIAERICRRSQPLPTCTSATTPSAF